MCNATQEYYWAKSRDIRRGVEIIINSESTSALHYHNCRICLNVETKTQLSANIRGEEREGGSFACGCCSGLENLGFRTILKKKNDSKSKKLMPRPLNL